MKKTIITFLLVVSSFTAMAQQADQRIGELLNSSDWFALDREYPALKDSVHYDFLRLLSETMLAYNFNRPEDAVTCIDTLLAKHQQEIGFGTVCNMVMLKAKCLGKLERYAEAADFLHDFISHVKGKSELIDLSAAEEMSKFYDKLRACRPMTLLRPDTDVSVKFCLEPVKLNIKNDTVKDRGNQACIKVTANGKPRMAIFDTGAELSFCSMAFMRESGAHILVDLMLNGVLVSPEKGNSNFPFDGNVGLDLIEHCSKATFNLKEMFLKIE